MHDLPEFEEHLTDMLDTHLRKRADYSGDDPLENFDRAARVISWFENPRDIAFVVPIITKIARLATLLNREQDQTGAPLNEPVADSFKDIGAYVNLWWCAWGRRPASPNQCQETDSGDGKGARLSLGQDCPSPGERTRRIEHLLQHEHKLNEERIAVLKELDWLHNTAGGNSVGRGDVGNLRQG
jgi:hypothetical protein